MSWWLSGRKKLSGWRITHGVKPKRAVHVNTTRGSFLRSANSASNRNVSRGQPGPPASVMTQWTLCHSHTFTGIAFPWHTCALSWLSSWPISIEDPMGARVRGQAVIVPRTEVAGLPWIRGYSFWNTTKAELKIICIPLTLTDQKHRLCCFCW